MERKFYKIWWFCFNLRYLLVITNKVKTIGVWNLCLSSFKYYIQLFGMYKHWSCFISWFCLLSIWFSLCISCCSFYSWSQSGLIIYPAMIHIANSARLLLEQVLLILGFWPNPHIGVLSILSLINFIFLLLMSFISLLLKFLPFQERLLEDLFT